MKTEEWLWSQVNHPNLALLRLFEIQKKGLSATSSKNKTFLGWTVPNMVAFLKFQMHQNVVITTVSKILCGPALNMTTSDQETRERIEIWYPTK